jgi:hypothetical protein
MEENDLILSLRQRIGELEGELGKKDEEMLAKLRALRQESDQMRLLSDKRVAKLQKDLADTQKKLPLTGRNKLNKISELERTVAELRRFYGDKVKILQNIIRRMRKGERVAEEEVREANMNEDGTYAEENQQQQQQQTEDAAGQQSATQVEEEAKYAEHHDNLQVPNTSHGATDIDIPRSPLRAHAQPHPYAHPAAQPMVSSPDAISNRDFLIFKQTLAESQDRELHHLTSKYELQIENLKKQWDSQVQLIRNTHDADVKLQQSLLQQAQDECLRLRQTLNNEMHQRSVLQEQCLKLESELQAARNSPAYADFQGLQLRIERMSQQFEQREKEYEVSVSGTNTEISSVNTGLRMFAVFFCVQESASLTLEGIKQERLGWEDKLRRKNEQLAIAQQRFEQLTLALKQVQEQMNAQKGEMMRQRRGFGNKAIGFQQQQPQQQHTAFPVYSSAHADAADPHHYPSSALPSFEGVSLGAGSYHDDEEDEDIARLIRQGKAGNAPPTKEVTLPLDQSLEMQWQFVMGDRAGKGGLKKR